MFFLLKAMVLSNLRLKRTGAKGDSYRKIFENPLDNSSFFIYASAPPHLVLNVNGVNTHLMLKFVIISLLVVTFLSPV